MPSDILIPSRAGSERVSGTAHAKKEDPRYDAGLGTEHEEDIEGTYQEPSQALSAVSLTPKAPDTGAKAAGPAPPATATSASGQKLPAAPRRNSSGLKRGVRQTNKVKLSSKLIHTNLVSFLQPALAELVRSAGGQLQLSTALSEANPVFFRDVIRQGYLSKLPPPGNRIQTWRQRYFKLVVALSRSMAGGPVFLEYYADHNAKHPKGVIDLDQVVRIGKPLAATLEKGAVRAYRNVPHENLFELDMPKRCYRVLATSEAERDDWVGTLRDIMGRWGGEGEQGPRIAKSGRMTFILRQKAWKANHRRSQKKSKPAKLFAGPTTAMYSARR